MKKCEQCNISLEKVATKHGIYWHCNSCGGMVASIGFLRQHLPDFIVNQIWQKARNIDTPGLKTCPSCGKKMFPILSKVGNISDTLDVCKTCQLVWFDKGEYDVYPQKTREKTIYDYLSPEDREKLALAQMEQDRELMEMQNNDIHGYTKNNRLVDLIFFILRFF